MSVLALVFVMVLQVDGHGRLFDPPGRSTMWRLGFDTQVDYNDHQLFCGGFKRQWIQNGGRCGVCGDPWDLPRPRPHETGGVWGTGTIARVYREGQAIVATVQLTTNHLGWFEFRLCPNDRPGRYVKQRCLNEHVLKLLDYPGTRYRLTEPREGLHHVRLQLPPGLTCSQCVFQWHYTTGNNWGICVDGSDRPGCGPQEVFRGCSDVAVLARDDPSYHRYGRNLTSGVDVSRLATVKAPDRTSVDQDLWHNPHSLGNGMFIDPFDTAADDEEEGDLINGIPRAEKHKGILTSPSADFRTLRIGKRRQISVPRPTLPPPPPPTDVREKSRPASLDSSFFASPRPSITLEGADSLRPNRTSSRPPAKARIGQGESGIDPGTVRKQRERRPGTAAPAAAAAAAAAGGGSGTTVSILSPLAIIRLVPSPPETLEGVLSSEIRPLLLQGLLDSRLDGRRSLELGHDSPKGSTLLLIWL